MNVNDTFTINEYDEAYQYVSTHEYTTIEDLGNGQYKIVQLHIPTEEEINEQEKERISKLNLTGADVERGIYKAKGLDFDDVIELVKQQAPEQVKALKIELKANNFYRGNPYVEQVGKLLGFTSIQLDRFFETNNYEELLPPQEPSTEPSVEPDINK